MVITDSGIGFDTAKLADNSDKLHVGLAYAKEQIVGICGGEIEVESTLGKGTRIRISLPRENNTYFSLHQEK